MLDPERLLARLNPPQRTAVTHGGGPLLILAGAGSGKTRVITHRVAYLVGILGVSPRDIVAVTFTNKAAGEMRERVERILGQDLVGAFVGTFHAFGLRILRTHAADAGYPSSFVVYDTADQLALVRQALKAHNVDEKGLPPRQVLTWISRQKNAFIDPAETLAQAQRDQERVLALCYAAYEDALRRAAAMDFDDLLVQVIRLFRRRLDIAERHAQRIRYLLVDEYQDTNALQYALIRILAGQHRNLCCVGDEDQSIYAFRGADITNILDFTRDFPDAHVVKLEQNYRSSATILAAAAAVIRHNVDRHPKTLWTENAKGERLLVKLADDDREEADFVVDEMLRRTRESDCRLDQMAVLYRTNATSRLIEDRLMARRIPYRVVGSLRFYDRKEIKDALAWLRMLVHPDSDQDFLRAATVPPRGLGDTTLEELSRRAAAANVSLHATAHAALDAPQGLATRALTALRKLLDTVRRLTDLTSGTSTAETIQVVLEELEYDGYLEKAYPGDHVSRRENLDALVSAAREHDELGAPDGLAGFLDRVSLRSDTDDTQGAQGPTLMTVHSAKGLEFDGVFLVGLNRDLFPHALAQTRTELEEERRLMYVALTRARRFVVGTAANYRYHFGKPTFAEPSPFLGEIPAELIDERGARRSGGDAGLHGAVRGASPSAWLARSTTPAAGTSAGGGERRYEPDPEAVAAGIAGFRPGMRVIHPSFGAGTVLSAAGRGDKLTLTISFVRHGQKKIMPRYTSLMPAGT